MSKFAQYMEQSQTCEDDLDAPVESNVNSISWRCRSASVVAIARTSTPVVCHWNVAKQVRDSQRSRSLEPQQVDARSPIDAGPLRLTAADAAWANRPDGSSTSGHVIMAAHPNILRGESSTVSVLAWNSRKIRRVVRSSLGAECSA